MPASAELHAQAEGLPLEFVYLCTDSGGDQQGWQRMIAKHQVGGTHLFVPASAHVELLEMFSGRGDPTYVLIKPDGTVDKAVARPSDLDREKLTELIR